MKIWEGPAIILSKGHQYSPGEQTDPRPVPSKNRESPTRFQEQWTRRDRVVIFYKKSLYFIETEKEDTGPERQKFSRHTNPVWVVDSRNRNSDDTV